MKPFLEATLAEVVSTYGKAQQIEIPSDLSFELLVSKDSAQGDFASNIAFRLSKIARQAPKKIAEDLIQLIATKKLKEINRLEVGGAGFLNIYLAKTSLTEILYQVRSKDVTYGSSNYGQQKKVLVEFVSANPTGPLTIAHGRQAVLGDAIVRILKFCGYDAQSEYYLNDAGRQMNLLGKSLWARYCQELGRDVPLPEDGYQGLYLVDIAKQLRQEKGDSISSDEITGAEICKQYAQDFMMNGIRSDLKTIDVDFQSYFSETTLYHTKSVEAAFEVLEKKGYLYEKDGALWFRSTDFKDDKDRVLRKSSGELTYISPDIAYHRAKFERGYQWIVDLMGPDHHGYINRLKAACSAMGYDPDAVDVRIVQLTTLYRKGEPVRMSTRAGEFVTLKELVDEVGSDATRFFFLMRKIDSHLDFDLDLAKEKSQDNPVFYLQYAHARISSILRNSNQTINPDAQIDMLTTEEEEDLIKRIYEFSDALIGAGRGLEPFRVVDYLRELAASFHKFYAKQRVLSEDPKLTQARLLLIDSVRIVLRNGLSLLGISQPQSM